MADSADIRNVLLLGHTGTGKSTLAEAMLAAADPERGAGRGDRPQVLDFTPEEADRGHSLSLTTATMVVDGCRINVLDAPGAAEATGDAHPALGVADCAVFVVDAAVGLQPQHTHLWGAAAARGLPRMLFLNKLDLDRASYQDNVDALREVYGDALAPVQMPMGVGEGLTGVIDLLHFEAVRLRDGRRVHEEIPGTRREQAERNRLVLVEALVENDDDLLADYLEGRDPTVDELAELFGRGIVAQGFFPLLCGSARTGVGVELLLDFLVEEGPSPLARSDGAVPVDPAAPTAAIVFKTRSDRYLGRINLCKVLSGRLEADDPLTCVRTGTEHRIHQLFRLTGDEQEPVGAVPAGDIVAVAKLEDVVTGDLLCLPEAAEVLPELSLPQPPEGYHRVTLEPVGSADDGRLSTAVARLREEDPSVQAPSDDDAGGLVLGFYGPQHVAVTIDRLADRHGVEVRAEPAPVPFRETIRSGAPGIGKHIKQSGGHGQYGVAQIELSSLPRGSGVEFEDVVSGGAIPSQFIGSVEAGVREALGEGPLGGFPVVDVHVRLVDGKHHTVDSSDAAFRMAGILAVRDALEASSSVLLEPVMEVDVAVPDDLVGTLMSDLSARRGRILGTDAAGSGRAMIHAEVPEVELTTFTTELRSLTSGRAAMAMRRSHHQEVAGGAAGRLLEIHGGGGQ